MRTKLVLAAAVFCCSVGITTIALAGSSTPSVSPTLRHSVAVLQSPAARRAYKISKKDRTRHSVAAHTAGVAAEPATVSGAIATLATSDDPNQRAFGLDVSQTVEVDPSSASSPVWIVPGAAGACYVDQTQPAVAGTGPGAGTACTSAAVVARQGEIGITGEADGSHLIDGIVPNGNKTITVTEPSGASITIPVTDNTVSQMVPEFPTTISLNSSTGSPVVLHP
jgi:hypothetical protein